MLASRYGDRGAFLQKFNPSYQREICTNQDDCFFGIYPTLAEVRLAYGKNAPTAWIVPQLTNLAVMCGCKDKLTELQYEELAFIISNEYYYLKISELMLFFYRFKAGKYGRFYGAVDPLVITTSLCDFLDERAYAIDRHDQEERDRKYAEEKKHAISYEEYIRRKEAVK